MEFDDGNQVNTHTNTKASAMRDFFFLTVLAFQMKHKMRATLLSVR